VRHPHADSAGGRPAIGRAGEAEIEAGVRAILADVTGRPELRDVPPDAPLFGAPVDLDSLTGTLLLRRVRDRFGVDVAGEDVNLDALATLGALVAFLGRRVRR